jgi:hypothetical protein
VTFIGNKTKKNVGFNNKFKKVLNKKGYGLREKIKTLIALKRKRDNKITLIFISQYNPYRILLFYIRINKSIYRKKIIMNQEIDYRNSRASIKNTFLTKLISKTSFCQL